MELKDFITQTITAIILSSKELENIASDNGVIINPKTYAGKGETFIGKTQSSNYSSVTKVDFDVAVNASNEDTTGGKIGAKIQVFSFGVNAENTNLNATSSRIKFSMNIMLPPSSDK